MKIQYANWTDAAPQNLSQKDAIKLAKQLKTYVNSTKFIQEGSKIDSLTQQGILTKVPIKDVVYYTDPQGSHALTAQQLDDLIHTAVITKDPQLLRRASLYRFYTGSPIKTKKELDEELQKDYKHRLRRNALIVGLSLGVAGGSLPIISRRGQNKRVTKDTVRNSAIAALYGMASGATLAGFMTKPKEIK